MKKLFEAIINFFKRLFGIKQKPVEEPAQTGTIENPQSGTTELETPSEEEVDCSKLTIYPKDDIGLGGKIKFIVRYVK